MTQQSIGDLLSLRTADGTTMVFSSATQAVLSYGNFGAPPIEFHTRRGYRQDGETVEGYTLQPRPFALELWFKPGSDRQAYWDTRARLLNLIRPNRNGPLTLTVRLPDGRQRAITARADPGPMFPPADDNNWQVQETIRLIAFDPVWYDPTPVTIDMLPGPDEALEFPIEFPIWFGFEDAFQSGVITYTGTWDSDTVIALHGGYTYALIQNRETGAAIFLTTPISDVETRILDLRPGRQSIRDGSGANRFGDLGPGSDLQTFALKPAPDAPGGQQSIQILLVNPGPDAAARLTYYTRFYAI